MSPEERKLKWTVRERIGMCVINPLMFAIDAINRKRDKITIDDASEMINLIKECISYVPNDRKNVMNRIIRAFPHMKEIINRIEKCGMLL